MPSAGRLFGLTSFYVCPTQSWCLTYAAYAVVHINRLLAGLPSLAFVAPWGSVNDALVVRSGVCLSLASLSFVPR